MVAIFNPLQAMKEMIPVSSAGSVLKASGHDICFNFCFVYPRSNMINSNANDHRIGTIPAILSHGFSLMYTSWNLFDDSIHE